MGPPQRWPPFAPFHMACELQFVPRPRRASLPPSWYRRLDERTIVWVKAARPNAPPTRRHALQGRVRDRQLDTLGDPLANGCYYRRPQAPVRHDAPPPPRRAARMQDCTGPASSDPTHLGDKARATLAHQRARRHGVRNQVPLHLCARSGDRASGRGMLCHHCAGSARFAVVLVNMAFICLRSHLHTRLRTCSEQANLCPAPPLSIHLIAHSRVNRL